MSTNFIKNLFGKKSKDDNSKSSVKRANINEIEKYFTNEDYVNSAITLKTLLEFYGQKKKKAHKYKGREFIHFILSNKHKDLKNIGYTHWQNINKIIQKKQKQSYPYHKKNLRNAIDFYTKEIRSINTLNVVIG